MSINEVSQEPPLFVQSPRGDGHPPAPYLDPPAPPRSHVAPKGPRQPEPEGPPGRGRPEMEFGVLWPRAPEHLEVRCGSQRPDDMTGGTEDGSGPAGTRAAGSLIFKANTGPESGVSLSPPHPFLPLPCSPSGGVPGALLVGGKFKQRLLLSPRHPPGTPTIPESSGWIPAPSAGPTPGAHWGFL